MSNWDGKRGDTYHYGHTVPKPAAAKLAISDELVERMVALTRRVADSEPFWVEETEAEARAIVAELTVDPDVEEAKAIIYDSEAEDVDTLALAAIKRGRALERGEP
jgi:hypothetical protein